MKAADHAKRIEKEWGKSLRDVMFELCIEQDVIAAIGADMLGVPRSTFESWRNRFRVGPLQYRRDRFDELKDQYVQGELNNAQMLDALNSLWTPRGSVV